MCAHVKEPLSSFGNDVVANVLYGQPRPVHAVLPQQHTGLHPWVNTDVAQLSSITQLHTIAAQAWPWIRKGDF